MRCECLWVDLGASFIVSWSCVFPSDDPEFHGSLVLYSTGGPESRILHPFVNLTSLGFRLPVHSAILACDAVIEYHSDFRWIPQEEDESSKHEQSDINDAEKALLGPDDESSLSAAFPVDEKKALPVPA